MPRNTNNSSGNSGNGVPSPSRTQGAQGTSNTQGSTNSTSNDINMYQAQKSTKLNLEPLTPDGDFAAFEEAFKAEMKVRRLAHHFPGLVSTRLATQLRDNDNNPFGAMDAHSLLIMSLHPDVRASVREYIEEDDPALLWEELVKIRRSTNDTTVAKIANQAQSIQQGQSEPLATYINRLDALHRRVKSTDYEMNDKIKWLNLVRGLLPMFIQIAREITRDPTKDTYVKRRTDLLVTATDYVGDPHKPPSTTYEGRALNTQDHSDKEDGDHEDKCDENDLDDNSKFSNKDCPEKDIICHYCDKRGHKAKKCFKKKKDNENKKMEEAANKALQVSEDYKYDTNLGF